MSINLYYTTQKIRGVQQQKVKYTANSVVHFSLTQTKFECPRCGSRQVTIRPISKRQVHGEPMGNCREVVFEFMAHRIYCSRCKSREMVPFPSQAWSRMTKSLEQASAAYKHPCDIQLFPFEMAHSF